MTGPHRQSSLDDVAGRRVALLLVDLQNDYCHPDGVFHRAGLRLEDHEELARRINRLAGAARRGGHLVAWTRMVWDDDRDVGLLARKSPFLAKEGLRRGTWGAELLDGLDVDPGDLVVEKPRFSSFYRTDLESTLAERGIDVLVAAGVRTDFCVESTVRDAFFRDLEVFVVRDAVAGYFPELHAHSLRVMDTVFARVVGLEEATSFLARPVPQRSTQEV